jgi:hypothetical protein
VVKVLLILAAVVDVALAALLIGVSGFLFGAGPESMHGGAGMLVAYVAAVIACVAAPMVGFILIRRGKPAPGVIVAWVPAAGAVAAMLLPPPY